MAQRLAIVLAVVSLAPGAARADGAAAQQLFDDGVALMAAGKYAEACAKLEGSVAEDASPGAYGKLAYCYEAQGRTADAWSAWERVENLARNDAQRAEGAAHRAALAPDLPFLAISVADRPAGLVVDRDGKVIPLAELDSELPVNPGRHSIHATAPDRTAVTREITVAKRQHAKLELSLPVAPAQPPPIARTEASHVPWVSIAIAGAGVLGLGASGVVGLSARSERDRAREAGCNADLTACSATGLPFANTASSRATVADGIAIAGAALVVAGAVYYLVADRHHRDTTPVIAPTSDGRGAVLAIGGAL